MDNITSAVIALAEKHLGDFRIRNGQVVAKLCPFCQGGNSHDLNTFAVGMYNGAWSCLRGGCGKKGSFQELCNYFGEHSFDYASMPKPISEQKKNYEKPDASILQPLSDDIITYFARRKISEQTLKDFHVSSDERGNIVFPFFRDHVLTYVKFRKPLLKIPSGEPKEWQMKNTEPILFGMDNVSFNKPLIITEGEIDALSLYEAGNTNVVSVPAGCKDRQWIDLCWDWLENFQQIILFGDNDEPGVEMTSSLMKRLGESRCMIPKAYPDLVYNGKDVGRLCKDANEILCCYGPDGVNEIIRSCEPAPIKGVLNLAQVPFVDPTTVPRILTKVPDLDNLIGGFGEGTLTILSGKRGQGKSTIGGSFILNAIEQGYPACIYSGELNASNVFEWISLQATDSKYIEMKRDDRSGKTFGVVPMEIQQRIRTWMDGKLYLFDNAYVDDCTQAEAILKVFEFCARRYGCKMFLCDNVMSALISSDEENRAQAKFAASLKNFAVKFKASVLLVAHPRKTKPGDNMTNDDVAGSSALTNLADNVLCIEKPNIRILKNRAFGTLGYIVCSYDPANRRIFQSSVGDQYKYSWDHKGLTLPDESVRACLYPEFQVQPGQPEEDSRLFF